MKNILLLALLGLFAINTHQQDYDEDNHFHLRGKGGRGGKGAQSSSGGKTNWIKNKAKNFNGRDMSRTGHAITGAINSVDTVKNWFGKSHYAVDDESFE